MTNGVKYWNLRPIDLVLTTGKGIVPNTIKRFSGGEDDPNCATHAAIVVEFHGQLLLMEMLGKKGGISLSPFERYLNNNKRWIVGVRRLKNFIDMERIQMDIALDYRKQLKYPFKDLLMFTDWFIFRNVKNDKQEPYCSEYYVEKTWSFTDYPDEFWNKVSPRDLQKSNLFYDLDWEIVK